MKMFLLVSLTFLSLKTFAQSYLVLNNGVTLTVDKAGFVYDFHHFFLPYKVKINGSNFLISEKILYTIDANGFLYKTDLEIDDVEAKGGNYFIDDNYALYTIDEKGFYYKYDDKKYATKKASGLGGNFFVVTTDEKKKKADIYTVNTKGNFFKMTIPGLNPFDIQTFGGNWFITTKGVLYSVSKDGMGFSKDDLKVGKIVKRGGNYLIDETNRIYTISDNGLVSLPDLPKNLNTALINKMGSNYLIDSEGRLFVVDSLGNIFERIVPGHDLKNVKIPSLR
jgi:hypothetical protein